MVQKYFLSLFSSCVKHSAQFEDCSLHPNVNHVHVHVFKCVILSTQFMIYYADDDNNTHVHGGSFSVAKAAW